jgi:hypothetical protein
MSSRTDRIRPKFSRGARRGLATEVLQRIVILDEIGRLLSIDRGMIDDSPAQRFLVAAIHKRPSREMEARAN